MLGYAYIAEYYNSNEEDPAPNYLGFLTENLEGDTHALQAFLGESPDTVITWFVT